MSTTLRDDLWALAMHEAGHVAHAFLCGFPVDQVFVGRPKGFASITYSLAPETLSAKWSESPILWAGQLMRVIGTIRSGSLFEGLLDVSGDDCVSLGLWREAYVAGVGSHDDWTRLYADVYTTLLAWRQRAAVQQCVKAIAEGLLHQGEIGCYALQTLLAMANIQGIPEPNYTPLLPAPQRSPVPGVSTPAPRRVAGQVGVDLTKFARDVHGRVRQLTDSEWMFLKEHGVEAVAHNFTDSELDHLEAAMQAGVARQQGQRLARRQ